MLRTDGYRNTGRGAPANGFGERIRTLGEREQPPQTIGRGKLRLFRQYRRLTKENALAVRRQCGVEEILRFLHEDIEQLVPLRSGRRVAQTQPKRTPNLLERQTGKPLVENQIGRASCRERGEVSVA